jgi:hypothetical protein
MILFYIDESGTGLKDNQSASFILAGVAIHAEDWKNVDTEFNKLKQSLISFSEPDDWEIKGRDIRQGKNFFIKMSWEERLKTFEQIAGLISELPCKIWILNINKRSVPISINSNEKLYQLALWRMLDELNQFLKEKNEHGMFMIDARSNLHSSIQDRRLIDSYRKWSNSRSCEVYFLDIPWFGFSEFYAGLQIADFAAYLSDYNSNEKQNRKDASSLRNVYEKISHKVFNISIP